MNVRPPPKYRLRVLAVALALGGVTLPAHALTINQKIKALQMAVATLKTDNTGLKTQVAALQTDNATLKSQVSSLQQANTALQANSALKLGGKLSFDSPSNTALFKGVNVQIVNGLGTTASNNSYGNLTIGYNEPSDTAPALCSDGQHTDTTACTNAGETWGSNQHGGSDNLVLGAGQS